MFWCGVQLGENVFVHEHGFRAGVADNVCNFFHGECQVQRHHNGTQAGNGKITVNKFRRIIAAQCDYIARLDAVLLKVSGILPDGAVQLTVCNGCIMINESGIGWLRMLQIKVAEVKPFNFFQ